MGYTTPRTWVVGEWPTAAQLNANVRDNVSFLANPPACRVSRSSAQSIPDSTNTPVTMNTEAYDTDTIHSTVTNTSRLTCKTAGVYSMFGLGQWAANGTGSRTIFLIVNAATIIVQQSAHFQGAGSALEMAVAGQYKLAVNDYVELWVAQFSGGALNFTGAAAGMTWIGLG